MVKNGIFHGPAICIGSVPILPVKSLKLFKGVLRRDDKEIYNDFMLRYFSLTSKFTWVLTIFIFS
jgi:hypothetical protein